MSSLNSILASALCAKGSRMTVPYNPDDTYVIKVGKNETIDGYALVRGSTAILWKNGHLAHGVLAAPKKINEIVFLAGTEIEQNWHGKVWEAGVVEGQRIRGIKCEDDSSVSFHQNGKVYEFTPAEEGKMIQGIGLKAGWMVYFHENGKLKETRCSPSTPVALPDGQEVECKDKTTLQFYDDGSLESVHAVENLTIDGENCRKGYITFHKNGQVHSCSDPESREKYGGYKNYYDENGNKTGRKRYW